MERETHLLLLWVFLLVPSVAFSTNYFGARSGCIIFKSVENVFDVLKLIIQKTWCRLYKLWEKFILIWAIYSTFFTPMEFAFFKGLPRKLFLLDICGQIAFLVDIVIQFFVAYRDSQTYKMVCRRNLIALRLVPFSLLLTICTRGAVSEPINFSRT